MNTILTVLVILTACGAVGFALYLPFMLWFGYRKRRGQMVGDAIRLRPMGYVVFALMLAVLFAGIVFSAGVPDDGPLRWMHGGYGFLRWTIINVVAWGVIERMLMRSQRFELYTRPGRRAPASTATPTWARLGRRLRIGAIQGVPVYVGMSLPTTGLLIAVFTESTALQAVAWCAAYVALIAVHELGHFAAARWLGMRVHAIVVSGAGGSCITQFTRGVKDTLLLYCGGVMAQAALGLATLTVVAICGAPASFAGRCLFIMFTWVSLVVALVNLVPGKRDDEVVSDGTVLWELLMHVRSGAPHPLAKLHATSVLFLRETSLFTIEGMRPPDFQAGIEMLNDDSTPMEFVLVVLERHLGLDREEATAAMLRIHKDGGMLFALADRGAAEELANEIASAASAQGHVFVCRAVVAPAA